MTSIIGLLVLFLATLTLGGCAGMPYGLAGSGTSGYGYGGSCPQPYCASMPVPMPMDPGYAAAAPAVVYAPQPQLYYAPQPYVYNYNDATGYDRAARIRQGLHDGSLTPRGARLNTMQNRANQDIYHDRHNGVVQPGATGPHPGNGPASSMSSMGHSQINGARMQGPMQPQARPTQTGVAPSKSIAATPGQ